MIAPKRQRLASSLREAQLLEFAVVACSQKSLSRAVHADVARLADVSVPTVFRYFPTRRKLIGAVVRETRRLVLKVVNAALKAQSTAPEKLYESMWTCTMLSKTNRDYLRVWLDWSTAIQSEYWSLYIDFQEELVELYRIVIEEGQKSRLIDSKVHSGDAARILMGEAHMLVFMAFCGINETKIRRFLRHALGSALQLRSE